MNDGDEVTGERFIPEVMGGELIEAEHQVRYQLAMPHVAGRRVLDAGCGVGWGSALLAKAGAKDVVGVDLDQGAVTDAKRRAPDVEFLVADLLDLPFDDASFDVVVCFETIEHTGDTAKTLDELIRVLSSGGLLFASSPNPLVYPSGNPFHRNEETPEALLKEVQARLSCTRLIRQHNLIASLLLEDGRTGSGPPFAASLCSVTPLVPGHDPYSVVLASDEELPDITPLAVLAPSDQLDHITTVVDDVAVRYERQVQGVAADYERQAQEFQRTTSEIETELLRLAADRDALATRLMEVEAKRDSFAAMVLAAEQDLAKAKLQHSVVMEELLNSTSWKVTAPLRRLSAKLRDLA